jgi:phosphoribosylglycinamide formyltransferase-1
MSSAAKIGLFSTLTSSGSRQLVTTMTRACRDGSVPGAEIAFLFCNRADGESEVTDESVSWIGAEFGLPIIRASAIGFERDERLAAREAAEAGDDEPLWAWRAAYYASFRDRLLATDLDLLLGDMWIWSRSQCADRRGVNLHTALPSGPLGKMWYDVVWDLAASETDVSGVMLHRVTPEVDMGPVATYCRYSLHDPELEPLWAGLPECVDERVALIASQRALKRDATHPLFHALRAKGLAREMPLMTETVRAVGDGRLVLAHGTVLDGNGTELAGGLDLTKEVEAAVVQEINT